MVMNPEKTLYLPSCYYKAEWCFWKGNLIISDSKERRFLDFPAQWQQSLPSFPWARRPPGSPTCLSLPQHPVLPVPWLSVLQEHRSSLSSSSPPTPLPALHRLTFMSAAPSAVILSPWLATSLPLFLAFGPSQHQFLNTSLNHLV